MDEEIDKNAVEVPESTQDEQETSTEAATEAATPNGELIEYINRFAPGSDTSSPEALLKAATTIIQSLAPIYDKVYDLALTNPETAAVLNDWLETGDLGKAIVRNYDPEEVKALVEEMEDDTYEEDKTIYSDRVKQVKDHQTMMEKNMAASQMGAQEFVDSRGLSEADIEEFKPFVDKFLKDCEDRNLTAANWEIIYNGFKRDTDVAEAEENGKVMGRNEKIVAEKASREDIKDLLPGGGALAEVPKSLPKPKSFASSFMDKVI